MMLMEFKYKVGFDEIIKAIEDTHPDKLDVNKNVENKKRRNKVIADFYAEYPIIFVDVELGRIILDGYIRKEKDGKISLVIDKVFKPKNRKDVAKIRTNIIAEFKYARDLTNYLMIIIEYVGKCLARRYFELVDKDLVQDYFEIYFDIEINKMVVNHCKVIIQYDKFAIMIVDGVSGLKRCIEFYNNVNDFAEIGKFLIMEARR
jgi:hypothetical protein